MKKILLLQLLLSYSIYGQIQNISICDFIPHTVCIGDTAEIHYKYPPKITIPLTNTIAITLNDGFKTFTLWSANELFLYLQPFDEDSCRYLKVRIPCGIYHGQATLAVQSQTIGIFARHCFDCALMGIEEHFLDKSKSVYFDFFENKTDLIPNTLLIEQNGRYRRKIMLRSE